MSAVSRANLIRSDVHRADVEALPTWVLDRFGPLSNSASMGRGVVAEIDLRLEVSMQTDGQSLLAKARVLNSRSLPALAFQRAAVEAYKAMHDVLRHGRRMWYPIRFWNALPGIHDALSEEMDRYLVFNAGRHAVYSNWYNGGSSFASSIATATAVGSAGTDLVVHVLATSVPGRPVENPRQIPSYKYSSRYGPFPPCFARAMVAPRGFGETPTLLVGGTSSVRGESSLHEFDARRQTLETIENLAAVLGEALRMQGRSDTVGRVVDVSSALRRFDSVRIYHSRPSDLDVILDTISPHLDHLDPEQIEVVRADICRAELVVEIEGTASLAP
ncbi:MAG: hypothetical protein J5J06_11060 [Phycisphaerae bacterium]|nr:hypothetical protein [Phycisphaerae bacterium]